MSSSARETSYDRELHGCIRPYSRTDSRRSSLSAISVGKDRQQVPHSQQSCLLQYAWGRALPCFVYVLFGSVVSTSSKLSARSSSYVCRADPAVSEITSVLLLPGISIDWVTWAAAGLLPTSMGGQYQRRVHLCIKAGVESVQQCLPLFLHKVFRLMARPEP